MEPYFHTGKFPMFDEIDNAEPSPAAKDVSLPNESSDDSSPADRRLYVTLPQGWRAEVKLGWEQQFCHVQAPGDSHFHRIVDGELVLRRGDEVYCLNCALRLGYLTTNRINWQRGH